MRYLIKLVQLAALITPNSIILTLQAIKLIIKLSVKVLQLQLSFNFLLKMILSFIFNKSNCVTFVVGLLFFRASCNESCACQCQNFENIILNLRDRFKLKELYYLYNSSIVHCVYHPNEPMCIHNTFEDVLRSNVSERSRKWLFYFEFHTVQLIASNKLRRGREKWLAHRKLFVSCGWSDHLLLIAVRSASDRQ